MAQVKLIDHMGDDSAIVQSARVSYANAPTKSVRDDRALIRFLMRHRHTTPFEMVEFKFYVKCPIFVARQWLRHRTASVNEISARYSVVNDDFFIPETLREQSKMNKQCSGDDFIDTNLITKQKASCDLAFHVYDEMLKKGCSRELARCHLPQSTFTQFYWKIDLHNLLHFLKLRMHHHAQKEIRDLACAMYDLIKPIVPVTCEAFEDFVLHSVTLSRLEVEALRQGKKEIEGKGENAEFQDKLLLLAHSGAEL